MSRQPTMPSVSWETNSTPALATTTTTTTTTIPTSSPTPEQPVITTEEEKKDKGKEEEGKGIMTRSVENYHQFDLQLENIQKPLAMESEHLKIAATRQRKGMSLTEYRKRYGAMQS